MLRLIFWLLVGRRRPVIEDIRHLSSDKIQQAVMTVILHAYRKEEFLKAMQMLRIIVDRFDEHGRQTAAAQPDNVRPLQTNSQQNQHNNNRR